MLEIGSKPGTTRGGQGKRPVWSWPVREPCRTILLIRVSCYTGGQVFVLCTGFYDLLSDFLTSHSGHVQS